MDLKLDETFSKIFDMVNHIKDFDINVDTNNLTQEDGYILNLLGRENSKIFAKKLIISLQDFFKEKSKSDILNKLSSDRKFWEKTQYVNITKFNRLIKNSILDSEIQKLETERQNHMSFYHFFYNSIDLLQAMILEVNFTPSVSKPKTKKEIQNLIEKDKLNEVFDELLRVSANGDCHNYLISLRNQFTNYQNSETLGTLSREDEPKKNRIVFNLLKKIDELYQ